jgi:membrane associated rhomboid family serine protease
MGGYLLLFPRARVDVLVIIVVLIRVFAVPAWAMLGLWFAIQIISGLATPIDMGGVAYWAHAGGFAAGLALTWPLWRRRGAQEFWARTAGHPAHPPAIYSASHIPKVRRRR